MGAGFGLSVSATATGIEAPMVAAGTPAMAVAAVEVVAARKLKPEDGLAGVVGAAETGAVLDAVAVVG